jgi:hypothetical protein
MLCAARAYPLISTKDINKINNDDINDTNDRDQHKEIDDDDSCCSDYERTMYTIYLSIYSHSLITIYISIYLSIYSPSLITIYLSPGKKMID